ncbi:unnamed protein product [Pylaiella littoralis]
MTTSTTLPTAVSGFQHPCALGRSTRTRRPAGAGEGLRPPPPLRRLWKQQRQPLQQPLRQQPSSGSGSSSGRVSGRGIAGRDAAVHGGGSSTGSFLMRAKGGRAPAAASAASSRLLLLRCTAAAAGDSSNNYGSPDYSEYGYEPEFELQGEDGDLNADAETLAKWRLEKLLANDRWQFGKYGKQNVGNWVGDWQEFVAQELSAGGDEAESDMGSMIGIVPGKKFVANTRISRRDIQSAGNARIFEHEQGPAAGGEGQGMVGYDSAACPPPVVETLFPDSFRGNNGTQVVGNAYTTAEAYPSTAEDVWVEVGLRARNKHVRMRCVFQYGPRKRGGGRGGSEEEAGSGGSSLPSPPSSMSIRRVFLVREGLDRLPPPDAKSEPELYGAAGMGLYDPPALSRSPLYFSIYSEGGLTLRFPLEVEAGHGGVICVDWTVGEVRYQADRVFDALDGTVQRLEVTEIGTQDAENFLPMEKF